MLKRQSFMLDNSAVFTRKNRKTKVLVGCVLATALSFFASPLFASASGTTVPVYLDEVARANPLAIADPATATDPLHYWVGTQLLDTTPGRIVGCDTTNTTTKNATCRRAPGTITLVDSTTTTIPLNTPSQENGVLKLGIGPADPVSYPGYPLSTQAQIEHYYRTTERPTLTALLTSRPRIDLYTKQDDANPAPALPYGGMLKFRISCTTAGIPWMAYIVDNSNAAGTTDINGAAPAWNTWQTFQFPAITDMVATPALQFFGEGGTPPFARGSNVAPTDLMNACGNTGMVEAVTISAGRIGPKSASSTYLDTVSYLGVTYDFQNRPTPQPTPKPTPIPTPPSTPTSLPITHTAEQAAVLPRTGDLFSWPLISSAALAVFCMGIFTRCRTAQTTQSKIMGRSSSSRSAARERSTTTGT